MPSSLTIRKRTLYTSQMSRVVKKNEARGMDRMSLQYGERAVSHGETAPLLLIDPHGMTKDCLERPSMGGNQDCLSLPGRRIEYATCPYGYFKKRLAACRAADPTPQEPVLPILFETMADLLPVQPLPEAIVTFAEIRRRNAGNLPLLFGRDSLGRIVRPAQVARIDQIQSNSRQAFGQGYHLPPSPFV